MGDPPTTPCFSLVGYIHPPALPHFLLLLSNINTPAYSNHFLSLKLMASMPIPSWWLTTSCGQIISIFHRATPIPTSRLAQLDHFPSLTLYFNFFFSCPLWNGSTTLDLLWQMLWFFTFAVLSSFFSSAILLPPLPSSYIHFLASIRHNPFQHPLLIFLYLILSTSYHTGHKKHQTKAS